MGGANTLMPKVNIEIGIYTTNRGMNTSIYKHNRTEVICERRWSCKHFALRAKPKRITPESNTKDCEHYLPTIDTT
jgi:hypothetical protein